MPIELISSDKWWEDERAKGPDADWDELIIAIQSNAIAYGKQEGREEQREVDARICRDMINGQQHEISNNQYPDAIAEKMRDIARGKIRILEQAAEAIRSAK